MDNGARLPLYARARLGEGTRAAQGLHGVVGLSRGKESGCPAVEVGRGRLPPWKGRWSWDRKSFRMERGLAEPSSHPSPQPGNKGKARAGRLSHGSRGSGQGLGEKPPKISTGLRPAIASPPEPLCSSPECLFFHCAWEIPSGIVLPRWKPVRRAVAQSLLGASFRNNHLVSKESKIQGKFLKLTTWREYGGFAASPPSFT